MEGMSERRIPITITFRHHIFDKEVIDGLTIIDRKKGLSIVAMQNVRCISSGKIIEIGDVLLCVIRPLKELSNYEKAEWIKIEQQAETGVFLYDHRNVLARINDRINDLCPFNGGNKT